MIKNYSRELRIRIAKEATLPENKDLEHIIAKKYGVRPSTVCRWKMHYLEHGDESFKEGFSSREYKTTREMELEKENKELREEVEILKKAAAFLANVKRE